MFHGRTLWHARYVLCWFACEGSADVLQILLCLMITRAPTSALASPALVELDKICELFEEAANSSQIASNNIVRRCYAAVYASVTDAVL